MIHCGNHRNHGFPVCECQNGNLRPCHKFFDYDMVTACAEHLIRHHGAHRILCLLLCFCNDNAFTQCQTIRLHNGRQRCGFEISQRLFHIIKHFIRRCGDAVFFHQIFGEHLAALQNCRLFIRPEARNTDCVQRIHHAQNQRIIRCNNSKINALFLCEGNHAFHILRRNIYAGRVLGNAAVAGQCIQLRYLWIFFDFLNDGMLSAATANYHNFHFSQAPFQSFLNQ